MYVPRRSQREGERLACRRDHGSWFYVVDLGRGPDGKRRQEKVCGFRTRTEAEQALSVALKAVDDGTHDHDGRKTVAEFLNGWIGDKVAAGLRPTTERSYRQHIRDHLRPHLGYLRLRDLRPSHVSAMLRAARTAGLGAASVRRVHGTLRSALSSALRQQLVSFNAAVNLELPTAPRPKVRPWQPAELGAFLDSLGGDRLAALFELIASTGLRRGEACGLRWSDVDLTRGELVVRQQLVQVASPAPCPSCGQTHRGHTFGPPKTASGDARVVELDGGTIGILLAHRLAQDTERAEWGSAYVSHDLVFTRVDGNPLPLDMVTKRFRELSDASVSCPTLPGCVRSGCTTSATVLRR